MSIDQVWPFYGGHRVRHGGELYRVNRWGTVERRSRQSRRHKVRWIKCGPPKSREIRVLVLTACDELPRTWLPAGGI